MSLGQSLSQPAYLTGLLCPTLSSLEEGWCKKMWKKIKSCFNRCLCNWPELPNLACWRGHVFWSNNPNPQILFSSPTAFARNIRCGKLICLYPHTAPFITLKVPVLYKQVKDSICVSLDMKQPMNAPDPMLVQDGTSCGHGKARNAGPAHGDCGGGQHRST